MRAAFYTFLLIGGLGALSSCEGGAKRLDKKPKTHVLKEEEPERQVVSVYRTENAMDRPAAFRNLKLNKDKFKSNVEGGSLFELGMHFEDAAVLLTGPVQKKERAFVLKKLSELSETLEDLNIASDSLNDLIASGKFPESSFMNELFSSSQAALTEKGNEIHAQIMAIGNWVEHMHLVLSSPKIRQVDFQRAFLEYSKITAQNHLLSLVELGEAEEVDGYITDLNRIIRLLDRFSMKETPLEISRDTEGAYVIKGGAEILSDQQLLVELTELIGAMRNEK